MEGERGGCGSGTLSPVALGATIHRFIIELADTGRGVYESLDLRVARHPSETVRHMMARVLAYCLSFEPGIDFGRGVSTAEEPAVWVRDLRSDVTAWIDVGRPSPERLHRASKRAGRVVVYAHGNPAPLLRDIERATIHRKEALEVWALPAALLDRLEAVLERTERWSLTVSGGELYLTRGDETLEGALTRHEVGA